MEAIILEGEHIKKYQPKYNVEWKDDKSWNYIAITKDPYPKVITIRQREYEVLPQKIKRLQDHKITDSEKQLQHFQQLQQFEHVFGPYPCLNTRAMMKLVQKLFYFSTCHQNQKRPCLYRQMGQCLGVCTGEISPKEYRARII